MYVEEGVVVILPKAVLCQKAIVNPAHANG
jgi:hypothetical protein